MHVIEGVDFLLDVEAVSRVGVEHLCAWRWGLELGLFGLVVVVVVLAFVIDLVVDVIDRVSKGVQVFLLMFLGHVGVVLFLLETDLDRDAASVQVGLAIEEFYRKEGALLVLVINERPKLSLLQSDRLNFP